MPDICVGGTFITSDVAHEQFGKPRRFVKVTRRVLLWFHVVTMFTVDHTLAYDAHWARSICYPAVGDVIRLAVLPPLAGSAGWLWVAFRVPWGSMARREGWIHPRIVNAVNFNDDSNGRQV